jgi:quinohemoprotein amine dehydrogenase
MVHPSRAALSVAGVIVVGALLAWSPAPLLRADGYVVDNETVVDRCSRCHEVDDEGRMSRISYLRKTPEGWQTSVRRMVALNGVSLSPEDAREVVRYLANEQGLAPEELRPGNFEVERRMIDYDYPGDSGVEFTCIQCHSMGRIITQRRTGEEWALLLATHRALYPLVDRQARGQSFRGNGPDATHPMDAAIEHLSEEFPLETPEWSAWAATKRPPRLAGTWALSGYELGKGPVYGTVTISQDPNDSDAFTTSASYVYAESGRTVERSGQALVYTGYQWRGRSNPGTDSELREVMFVERDQSEISGRWFAGAYDEEGPDITLRRADNNTVVAGVYPRSVERGGSVEVRVFGAGLGGGTAGDLDFGAGVQVESVTGPSDGALRVRLSVAADAAIGGRDLFAFGAVSEGALVVHDGIDRIQVTPETGMARVGGGNFPKGYQTFEAIAYDDGPDGEANTADDLALGRVPVTWSVEEYATVYGDDDVDFVGSMGGDGVFTPAIDGPNPNRSGSRNNIGDVWIVATHGMGAGAHTARAHLLVTVPLYMRWEPWAEVSR